MKSYNLEQKTIKVEKEMGLNTISKTDRKVYIQEQISNKKV